jgi:lipid A 3-O-deacylase
MTHQHLGKQNIKVAPYFGALLFFCFATFSYASSLDNATPTSSSGDSKGAFSFAIENDLFGGGTDRHYTNGFQMAYISDAYHPEWIDTVASFVPLYRSSDNVRFGIAFGQSIFTPES